jgi:uncharacterized protein YkwD
MNPTCLTPRLITVLSLLVVACAAILALPASAGASTVTINPIEKHMIARINQYRASAHLPRLRFDPHLTRAARWMSRSMASRNYFSHTDSFGRSPFQRMTVFGYPSNTYRGENLAAGRPGVERTFQQWLHSAGHRRNMLRSRFRAIGISRVYDATSPYGYYWTTTFGSRVTA